MDNVFDENIFERLDTTEARIALSIGIAVVCEADDYEKRTGKRASTFVLRFKKPLNPHPQPTPGSRMTMVARFGLEVKVEDDSAKS